jgi:hypothetical protein
MEQRYSSSEVLEITDPEVAQFMLNGEQQRLIHPFMGRETTLTTAARELDVSVGALLYRVNKWISQGLVFVTRSERRAGRPVKLYRSTADRFFVPVLMTETGQLLDVLRDTRDYYDRLLTSNLARALKDDPDLGVSVFRNGEGQVQSVLSQHAEVVEPDASQKKVFDFFLPSLELDENDADGFRQELGELVLRYATKGGKTRYMLHVGFTPIVTQEIS